MGRRPPVRQLAERDLDRARHDAVLAPLVLVTHVEGVAVGPGEGLCVECLDRGRRVRVEPADPRVHPRGRAARQHAGEPVVPDPEELDGRFLEGSVEGLRRISATAAPKGTNQPTYEAKLSLSSMLSDPGRWPAANSARDRPSTT